MISERITPENISSLKENEVFCFGSNEAGKHGKGAAKTALKWGAEYGKGFGHYGQTVAIPTKDKYIKTLELDKIQKYVNKVIEYAENDNSHSLIFLVTEIGTGLAGYTPEDIAPMFRDAINLHNIHLPQSFWKVLSKYGPLCDLGHNGDCCCNCMNQITLYKHPWNTINKGSTSEESGLYACISRHACDDNRKGEVYESKHGCCELHIRKTLRELKLKNIVSL